MPIDFAPMSDLMPVRMPVTDADWSRSLSSTAQDVVRVAIAATPLAVLEAHVSSGDDSRPADLRSVSITALLGSWARANDAVDLETAMQGTDARPVLEQPVLSVLARLAATSAAGAAAQHLVEAIREETPSAGGRPLNGCAPEATLEAALPTLNALLDQGVLAVDADRSSFQALSHFFALLSHEGEASPDRAALTERLGALGISDPGGLLEQPFGEALSVLSPLTPADSELRAVLELLKRAREAVGDGAGDRVRCELDQHGLMPDPRELLRLPLREALSFMELFDRAGASQARRDGAALNTMYGLVTIIRDEQTAYARRSQALDLLRRLGGFPDDEAVLRFTLLAADAEDFRQMQTALRDAMGAGAQQVAAIERVASRWELDNPVLVAARLDAESLRSRLRTLLDGWHSAKAGDRDAVRDRLLKGMEQDMAGILDLRLFAERVGPGAQLPFLYRLLRIYGDMPWSLRGLYLRELRYAWGVINPERLAQLLGLWAPGQRPATRLHTKALRLKSRREDNDSMVDVDLMEFM